MMKIARVVTTKKTKVANDNIDERIAMLQGVCGRLTGKVDVLQTPGGYIMLDKDFRGLRLGEESSQEDFLKVTGGAEKILSPKIAKVADACALKAGFLTLGVDVNDDAYYDVGAELVGTYSFEARRFIHWTGKSYPVAYQANTLLYCMDLKTHLQEIAGYKVIVLGCHDLNMFSPRTRALINSSSYKGRTVEVFSDLSRKYRPTVVLQHPHFTDSPRIWTTGWGGVRKYLPTVTTYSSGIHYENMDGDPEREPRIEKVLANLKMGTVVDIIV